MGKKNRVRGGDLITPAGPLAQQIESGGSAKSRAAPREKLKRKRDAEDIEFISTDLSKKILAEARKQLQEDEDEKNVEDSSKRMRHFSLGAPETSDVEDEFSEGEEFEDRVIELDPKDEEELAKFIVKKGDAPAARTLFDIIQEKINEKKTEAECAMSTVDPMELNVRDMDPEVVEMYKEVGILLSKYRSGKIPKAFKIIPKMVNWEQILYITRPEEWTAAAMFQATRIFASSLNPKMCQRFYNLVLLPRLRDDIEEYKKLNFHLYQALCKAIYKPAAFFKGIILPLCESGTCTLREATVFCSVLQKMSIPLLHSAAALMKIADMDYNGSNSLFLRALIDKKYALPYKVIDAVVAHFMRQKNDERDMPVLWHQCLLAFCQRYKNDLSSEQKSAIYEIMRFQNHYLISPEIRRELEAKETEDGHIVTTVEVPNRKVDSMEF